MNCKHFVLFSLCVPFVAQSMDNKPSYKHIENLSTIISFNRVEKSVFELIRDDKDGDFGYIPVYKEVVDSENNRLFKQKWTIKTISEKRLESIALGYSIYYENIIKSEYNLCGYAIVCCNNNHITVGSRFMENMENDLKLYVLKNLYNWKKEDKTEKNTGYTEIEKTMVETEHFAIQ